MRRFALLLIVALSALGRPAAAMPAGPPPAAPGLTEPAFSDDGDQATLLAAVGRSKAWLAAAPRRPLVLGGRTFGPDALRLGLERFEALVRAQYGQPGFEEAVRAAFEWLPMGDAPAAHVTGYYLPVVDAREAAEPGFKTPLYGPPPDMIPIDLGAFRPSLAGQIAQGRMKNGRLVPYHTRQEIEAGNALVGKGLEVAWIPDAAQRAAMMLQGSGLLRFPDGRIVNANYAAQNGHVFQPGDANPSFVFFKLAGDGPFGCDGVPLTAGRSIATDKRLYPTGTLAWMAYPRARFGDRGGVAGWEPGGRFVLDQDTGGAIRGPGRMDVYWGAGEEAARRAATLNGDASVWFLVPR